MPKNLTGRVAMPDMLRQTDGMAVFGDVKLYNGDTISNGRRSPPEIGHKRESDISILHRFVRNGSDLSKLNGDFAFGAYDKNTQLLTLVRDQLGNRVLYYARRPEGLVFSTRIHCFFQIGVDRTDVDPAALGLNVRAQLRLTLAGGAGPEKEREVIELLVAHPFVRSVIRVSGEDCFVVELICRHIADVNGLLVKLQATRSIQSSRTSFVLDTFVEKRGLGSVSEDLLSRTEGSGD